MERSPLTDEPETKPTAAEGWYPDPKGSGKERRWNGTEWTQEIRGGTEPTGDKKAKNNRTVILVMVGLGGALIGGLIGYGGGISDRDDLQSQLDKSEAKVVVVERQRDALEDEAAEVASTATKLKAREASIDKKAAKLAQDEITVALGTIPDDGVWQVGTDFEPGTYRAPGGGTCYWATLGSADTSDITNNGLGKNPTVTLDSGWFETEGCGVWEKL